MNIKIAAATVLISLAALTGCSSQPVSTEPTQPKTGDAKTHSRIKALTDCEKLQAEFDLADKNSDRNREAGKLELSQAGISYMETALNRMNELKCFG